MNSLITQKYLLLWDRMGDYHRARVRELVRIVGEDRVWAGDLGSADGMYSWESGTDAGKYFLLSDKPVEKSSAFQTWKAFRKLVKKEGITHVCIPGYGRGAYILMLLWSRLTGRKVLMFAESWYPGSPVSDRLKGLFLKSCTHTVFVSGERARRHFAERLLYPPKKILTGYSAVDNDHFAEGKGTKADPPKLLCVARFSEEKNLALLIRAFKRSNVSRTWSLSLVGGGPLKEELIKLSADAPVEIIEWAKYADLPHIYAQAGCFVLPSRFEPWGLVANEAMAAGLPIILSDQVGALPELLEEGVNGWQFKSDSEDELVRVLNELSESGKEKREQMGKISREKVAKFSCAAWAQQIHSNW